MIPSHVLSALGGSLVGAVVGYGVTLLSSSLPAGSARAPVGPAIAEDSPQGTDGDAGVDPAMVANARLVESLRQCSQRLTLLADDESRAEAMLQAERGAEADASGSAQARRLARRDPSQADWKQMANTGTVRYLLPCASFNPTQEALDRLGLAPHDVPAVQSAFTAARNVAWAQIRPLCAAAAGGDAVADNLGLDACPQVILNAEQATNAAAADGALRAVGAVKAGAADPSAIPMDDAVATTFLALTLVAKDAERRLAAVLGPDDARAALYGSGSCGRSSEVRSAGGAASR
jgi:hypothetical protein